MSVVIEVPRLTLSIGIRLGLALLAVMASVSAGQVRDVLPWAILVVLLDLLAAALVASSTSLAVRAQALAALTTAAVAAAAGFESVGPAGAVLAAIPAYHAGTVFRWRSIPFVASGGALAAVVMHALSRGWSPVWVSGLLAWIVGVLIFCALGILSARMADATDESDIALSEARGLLTRLHEIAERIETGFDPPSVADTLLSDLADQVPIERAAVILAAPGGGGIPLAVSGSQRLDWAHPDEPDSPVNLGWRSPTPTASTATVDGVSRHSLTIPLHDPSPAAEGTPRGVVILQRQVAGFAPAEVGTASAVVAAALPRLSVALLFEQLRARAMLEERTRLARDMHNGVAQELAAHAYVADAVHAQVATSHPAAAAALDALRTDLRRTIADIRGQIADLRLAQRPDTTLGRVIGAALQEHARQTGTSTTLTLNESALRFPADVEFQIQRLVHDVLTDARAGDGVTTVAVSAHLEAPHGEITLWHDGTTELSAQDYADHPLLNRRASIRLTTQDGTDPQVHLVLGEGMPHRYPTTRPPHTRPVATADAAATEADTTTGSQVRA